MIQITPQMRILVAIEVVDGRKGIDSQARLCQESFQPLQQGRITAPRCDLGLRGTGDRPRSFQSLAFRFQIGGCNPYVVSTLACPSQ